MSSYRLKNGTVRTGSVAQYGRANRAIWDPKVSLGGVEWRRGMAPTRCCGEANTPPYRVRLGVPEFAYSGLDPRGSI